MQKKVNSFKTNYFSILNNMPGYAIWKDKDSNFLGGTQSMAELIGLKKSSELSGMTDFEIPCPASEFAAEYVKNDQKVITTGHQSSTLLCHEFSDRTAMILCKINPWIESNELLGTILYGVELSSSQCNSVMKQLLNTRYSNEVNKYYKILSDNDFKQEKRKLSKTELIILRELLSGKTIREIAFMRCRSIRTIESHFNAIKLKFNVTSRSNLIELAISEGYLSLLPNSFF